MTILMKVAYDGTEFCGYQIQRSDRTVQGELESALEKLLRRPVRTVCAGRTDTGVHALGQYVSFSTDCPGIEPSSFAPALNSRLPKDVTVMASRQVPDDFHAQYSARQRHYRYFLYAAPAILPHRRRYAWRIPEFPSLERLNRDASALVGTHDFSTFAMLGGEQRSTVRTISYARFEPDRDDGLEFRIGATGFLRRMVRSIVGTLIERERLCLRGQEVPLSLEEILARGDRRGAGTTAPPWGLFLYDVEYEPPNQPDR
ncbi:tRNA pseudouridine38-40 synthase [Alkalispirochaeta americana]|uniref:tRNA pseudouridine synthase A n=1 Tax=Alkalispirochaeta americana TaxID=159291 RepID=A0A1N6VMP1_9SPIO|nr:tRNA pseudouridine(38-40) synthase TruA [Alkalispirochaeta americana]SIQ79105.1 tRNA pseudouridine38-40 synthase [Alkalispirochaeta americana]